MVNDSPLLLLAGGAGYIGGRLLPLLERRGLRLRCVCRQPQRLKSRVQPTTEVVEGDMLVPGPLSAAARETGVQKIIYLGGLGDAEHGLSVGIRLYPHTPLARQAVEEGVVSPEDDLLVPRFYIRPGLEDYIQKIQGV